MKKLIRNIFIIVYAIIAILVTVCLLSYNEYKVSEFGSNSLLLINTNKLSDEYKKGDLVIADSEDVIKVGDEVFYYNVYFQKIAVGLAKVTNIEEITQQESTYTLEGDHKISSDLMIGPAKTATKISGLGTVLGILESKWGFLALIVLPSLIAFLYEVWEVIVGLKAKIRKKMKANNKIKVLLMRLTLIMLVITIYVISTTYALFQSQIKGSVVKNVGKWSIKINGADVLKGTSEEFNMQQFVVDENENTKPGKMAPGTTGLFELSIDPTDTQISVRYDISIVLDEITNDKVQLISVEKDSTNNIVKTAENTYTGIIPLEEIEKGAIDLVKIKFCWENDERNNMVDSEIGTIINSKIQIPVKVNITQYLGEEITAFSE